MNYQLFDVNREQRYTKKSGSPFSVIGATHLNPLGFAKVLLAFPLLIFTFFLFFSCSNPVQSGGSGGGWISGETATITINLGESARTAAGFGGAVNPEDLTHKLVLINTGTGQREEIPVDSATNRASKQVSPGTYRIEVKDFVKGWDYSEGFHGPFTLSGGQTHEADIQMQRMPNAIALSLSKDEPLVLDFDSIQAGSAPPYGTPLDITVYNFSDNPSVSITMNSPISGGLSWSMSPTSITQGGSAVITITPSRNSTGVYEEVLNISGPGGFSASVDLNFIVYPDPTGLISSMEQLDAIRGNLAGNYTLIPNGYIPLTGSWTPIGTNTARFTGSLDGNGSTIDLGSGLVGSTGGDYRGLFGVIGAGGTVKNLKLTGTLDTMGRMTITPSPTMGAQLGTVAGANYGTIRNISSSVNIIIETGHVLYVGGIAGRNQETGTIENCYNTGNITVTNTSVQNNIQIGGIAGLSGSNGSGAHIRYCWTSGNITASRGYLGGILGAFSELVVQGTSSFNNCVALNNTITFSVASPSTSRIGRISSGHIDRVSVLSNNFANSAMTSTGTYSHSFVSDTTTPATSSLNGASVPSGSYTTEAWWTTAVPGGPGWTITGSGNETNPWEWNTATQRPKLWFE